MLTVGLLLIATTFSIVVVLAYLMKMKKLIYRKKVEYLSNTHSSSMKSNAACVVTSDQGLAIHTNTNEAYALPTTFNDAHGIATRTTKKKVTSQLLQTGHMWPLISPRHPVLHTKPQVPLTLACIMMSNMTIYPTLHSLQNILCE